MLCGMQAGWPPGNGEKTAQIPLYCVLGTTYFAPPRGVLRIPYVVLLCTLYSVLRAMLGIEYGVQRMYFVHAY